MVDMIIENRKIRYSQQITNLWNYKAQDVLILCAELAILKTHILFHKTGHYTYAFFKSNLPFFDFAF